MAISKEFEDVTRAYIARQEESGEMVIHRGVDINYDFDNDSEDEQDENLESSIRRNKLVTQVIFLQNLPRIGNFFCYFARNLVVVDIPEGVTSIGDSAFGYCTSLTTVSFPRTLTFIGCGAFCCCKSLENVDLVYTNLQELGLCAFTAC